MARFSNERIKEADTALGLLAGSIVPVSKQEVHSKMEAVNGEDYEMVSALLFHYGLVREQDGYYHLTDQGREAARRGFQKYAREFDRKEAARRRRKAMEKLKVIEVPSKELKVAVVEDYRRKRRWLGLDSDQWRDLIGWSIAILSIVVSCIR